MSAGSRVDKQNAGYTYRGEDSALQRKAVLAHAAACMNLEDCMLSERSSPKDKFYAIPLA